MTELIDQFSDAAVYGDLDKVKSLLAEHPSLLNKGDGYGFTALHIHAAEGEQNFDAIRHLLIRGADGALKDKVDMLAADNSRSLQDTRNLKLLTS